MADKDEIVDVDALDFADDIEQIVISDYSEDDHDVEIVENTPQNTLGSELKISSVVSCMELSFAENIDNQVPLETAKEKELINQESVSELKIASVVSGDGQDDDDTSSECNFSYDSLTEEEGLNEGTTIKHAENERKRRHALRYLYHNLWRAISSEPVKPTCSKIELLVTACDMIKKLTLESRKLEYSAELCLQSNYRLHRRFKRVTKKKRKQSMDSKEGSRPGKVISGRASI